MKLKLWQAEAIRFAEDKDKCLIALDMGMGKSRVAIESRPANHRILVIAPSVATANWKSEWKKWAPDMTVWVQKNSRDDVDTSAQVIVISYALYIRMGAKKFLKPSYVIIDESHYIKNPKAKRTKAVLQLAKSVNKAMFLTGTPILNRPVELFPMLKSFGVVKNYRNFVFQYCDGWVSPWGLDARGASNLEELRALLKPFMFRRTQRDMKGTTPGQLPPRVLELDLPIDIREKKLDRQEIQRNPHSITIESISDIMLQSGLRKVPLAIQYIRDLLEMEDFVVVFCHHREVNAALVDGLSDYSPVAIHGGTDDKAEVALAWQQSDSRVLVANTAAAGVAINLTKAAYCVFVEASWTPAVINQAIARCDRMGQERVVRTDILTISRSIDAMLLHAILDKQDVINETITESNMSTKHIDRAVADVVAIACEAHGIDDPLEYLAQLYADTDAKPEAAEAEPEPEPEQTNFSQNDVRVELAKLMRSKGADAVRDLLGNYSATKLTDLDEEHFVPLIFQAREAISG